MTTTTAAAAAKSRQLCPTLCDPIDSSPTRLHRPWDSPGKNTGVGCHFLLQCVKVKSESEVIQSCPTLCDPMDYSPPCSSVHRIFQARGLECYHWAFLLMQMVKNPPAVRETQVPSLGQEDSPERGMATHSSVLAWEVPWTEEPDGLQSAGLQRVRHCKASKTFTFIIISIPREQQVLEMATGKCR